MKKVNFLGLSIMGLLCLSACSDSVEDVLEENNKTVKFSFDVAVEEDAATRLGISNKDGNKFNLVWETSDEIRVWPVLKTEKGNKKNPKISYSLGTARNFTAASAGTVVRFDGEVPEGASKLYALYPAQSNATGTCDANTGEVTLTVSVSNTQHGYIGTFDKDAALMGTAFGTDVTNTVTMSHACAFFKVTITDDNVKSIDIAATNSNWIMAGPCYLSVASGEAKINFLGVTNQLKRQQSTSIHFVPEEGNTFEPGEYFIATAPSTDFPGLKVTTTYYNEDGSEGTYTRTRAGSFQILRGHSVGIGEYHRF